jgi:integrase
MAGQIINRGNKRWLVRVFTGRDADGKRCYFNKTIHGTKKDAQKWLTAALRDQDMTVFVEPASMPLTDYLDKWLLTVKHCVRERTFDSYEWLLEKYVRPTLGQKRLCDLKAVEVQKVYNSLTEDKKLSAKNRASRSPATVVGSEPGRKMEAYRSESLFAVRAATKSSERDALSIR